MRERNAQIVLLVRAFEEADREGVVLPPVWLATATHRARMVTVRERGSGRFSKPGEETLVRRARHVFGGLWKRVPQLYRVLELTRLRSMLAPSLVTGAFLCGLLLSALDRGPRVDMVSLPLIVLVIWSSLVYVALTAVRLCRPLTRRLRHRRDLARRHPLAAGLAGWVVRAALWRSRLGWRRQAASGKGATAVIARAFVRFCALWQRTAGPLLVMRMRAALHVTSMALPAGVLLGMWLRCAALGGAMMLDGAPLRPATVDGLLRILLAPAAALTDFDLAAASAAEWLAAWAFTLAWAVWVPRAGLTLYTAWRATRMARAIPIDVDEPYYRRVLA